MNFSVVVFKTQVINLLVRVGPQWLAEVCLLYTVKTDAHVFTMYSHVHVFNAHGKCGVKVLAGLC